MATFWNRRTRRRISLLFVSMGSLLDFSGQATVDHLQAKLGREIRPSLRDGFEQDQMRIAGDWQRVVKRVAADGVAKEQHAIGR